VPDEFLGQAVKAFVVLEAGAILTPRAIQLECQRRLEPHCVPKTIVVVPELPKTNTGKIQKQGLC
jgi:acyl-coenzyme A synthetase/AMP-(fatty) acid ligase